MSKIMSVEIERCFYCDYQTAGISKGIPYCLCTKEGREIEDCENVIPSWCLLPDKKEAQMSEKKLRETLAQIEYCRQNCNQTKRSCKKSTVSCRAVFKDELLNPDSWPNVMADQNISLFKEYVKGIDNPYDFKPEGIGFERCREAVNKLLGEK
jgi:hypothetical protein